jgi:hypothetical protein
VDLILGSTSEVEKETTESAGDAAVSGIPAAVAMNIAPAICGYCTIAATSLRLIATPLFLA